MFSEKNLRISSAVLRGLSGGRREENGVGIAVHRGFGAATQDWIIGLHNCSERKLEGAVGKTNPIDSTEAFVSAIRM